MNLFKDSDPNWSGLEQVRSLIDSNRRPAMYETLDFRLIDVEPGRAVFEGIPGASAVNPLGVVHGGYAATLLDSACGTAVHASLSAEQAYTTIEFKIQYHRAISLATGPVRAEGKVATLGRRVAFAEGRLTNAAGDC